MMNFLIGDVTWIGAQERPISKNNRRKNMINRKTKKTANPCGCRERERERERERAVA